MPVICCDEGNPILPHCSDDDGIIFQQAGIQAYRLGASYISVNEKIASIRNGGQQLRHSSILILDLFPLRKCKVSWLRRIESSRNPLLPFTRSKLPTL